MSIAVVVPTIRQENYQVFRERWHELFVRHDVTLLTIWDGEEPYITSESRPVIYPNPLTFEKWSRYTVKEVMGKQSDLIHCLNDGVRNLGFAFAAMRTDAEYILTLDDDVYPIEGTDPIQDHIDALNMRVPISWISTASEYMRGFPYDIRSEAEVALSHGVWEGVKDYDAPTQLTQGNKDVTFYRGPIPKGIFYPMCIMNVCFRRKMIPYMYQAPMGKKFGVDRFADIWCGIESKKKIDEHGWAAVSGYSTIYHSRASNVFTNLQKEARGIGLNETFWRGDEQDPYFHEYGKKRKRWEKHLLGEI